MKARRLTFFIAFTAAAFLALSVPSGGQSLADCISALLLEFPAETAADRDAAASELIRFGPAAVADLCGRLAEPGTADDNLVRFALDAVAVRSGRPGAPNDERAMVVGGILKSLDGSRDPEVGTFMISLLQKIGKAEIVKPLARFLSLPALAGPVVRALIATGVPEAETALIKALRSARGGPAVAIIQGLGDLRSRKAVSILLRLGKKSDAKIRAAALDALANIGDPSARPALECVRVAAPFEERAGAAARLLLFGRRLAEYGLSNEAAAIARPFLSEYSAPGEDHIRAAALTLIMDTVGENEGLGILMEAAGSPEAKYRQKALDIAAGLRMNWSAAGWIGLLDQAAPDVQADVIRMLARRGETAALPAIREKLHSGGNIVRREVAIAAARLGGAGVWEDIVPLFHSGDEADVAAAKSAASLFPSDVLVPKIAEILPTAPPAAQMALLEILAERTAKSRSGDVLSLCSSPDENVRIAALTALEHTVSADDLSAVVDLLLHEDSPREIVLIQNAAAAAARQIPEPEARAVPLLKALESADGPKRIELLRTLSKIGGAAALETVRLEIQNPDPQVQAVAVFALANWPDESAIPDLLQMARSASDRKFRYLALQGIARLIPGSGMTTAAKLDGLRAALDAAVEADEKIVILDGIAAARAPEGLNTIVRFIDDPEIRDRAAGAVLELVMPAVGYDGMTGMTAVAALKRAVPFVDYEFDGIPAERRARELLAREGFRPLFNGKDLSGWKGLVADPPKRAGMTPAALISAQAEADAEMRAHWRVVDGVLSFDGKGQSLCTGKDYGDFEMFVDWKIEPGGDSGLYLRGSPQVQIWDPAQWPEGSGGLYNNKTNPNKPAVRADRPAGEWNTFYIKMAGEKVTVDLNGIRVVDGVVMENDWERDKPIYPAGQIELQSHGTTLSFKNFYLREIPADLTISADGI